MVVRFELDGRAGSPLFIRSCSSATEPQMTYLTHSLTINTIILSNLKLVVQSVIGGGGHRVLKEFDNLFVKLVCNHSR